jgi:plastocyanin
VAAGGKVTVTNRGQAPHTMTLDDVQLDTGNIAPGASAELTAPDAPGSYSYRCAVHPARMRGVLVVLGRNTEDPSA